MENVGAIADESWKVQRIRTLRVSILGLNKKTVSVLRRECNVHKETGFNLYCPNRYDLHGRRAEPTAGSKSESDPACHHSAHIARIGQGNVHDLLCGLPRDGRQRRRPFWILQPMGGCPVLDSKLGPDLGMCYRRLNATSAISNEVAFSSRGWFDARDFGSLVLLHGVGRIGRDLDQSGAFQSP